MKETLKKLQKEFPAVFGNPPKVLQIRARQAIKVALPDLSKRSIKRALGFHCNSDDYIKELAKGGNRHALDGTPCGEITAAHIGGAKVVLARRKRARKAKSATEKAPVKHLKIVTGKTLSLKKAS